MTRISALASPRLALSLAVLGIAALSYLLPPSPANALEEGAGEAKAIDACDQRLCTLLQRKDPKGEDLKCTLTKTWAKSTIKEAYDRNPAARQHVRDSLKKVRNLCIELRIITPASKLLWKAFGIWEEPAAATAG